LPLDWFRPSQSQPGQILQGGRGEFGAAAILIKIVNPEEQFTPGLTGPGGRLVKGAGMAEVQITGGRGGKSAGIDGKIFNHGKTRMSTDYRMGVATLTSFIIYLDLFVTISGLPA
jgi:hypothetical protein